MKKNAAAKVDHVAKFAAAVKKIVGAAPAKGMKLTAATKKALAPVNPLNQKEKDAMKKSAKAVAKLVKKPVVKVAAKVPEVVESVEVGGKMNKAAHAAFVKLVLGKLTVKKGLEVGKDAKGHVVHIGDVVDHIEKEPLKGGVVVQNIDGDGDPLMYKGEDAVGVIYPPDVVGGDGRPHLNRLSKMVVSGKPVVH